MDFVRVTLCHYLLICIACASAVKIRNFPDDFIFGVATASYQIEGGWNASDKGPSIWDTFTHASSWKMIDGKNGDEACDSYNQYKRDVEMIYELGVDFYRFSLSWSRILPTGFSNIVSKDGVGYYNNLIDELLLYNITPVITLYHWDLPQSMQNIGGWSNPMMADYFVQYADVAFRNFGDRVKTWLTINEPHISCLHGYGRGQKAPGIEMNGIGEYICGHNILLAHSKAYHLYDRSYRKHQGGKIGLTLNASWKEPATNSTKNRIAAERSLNFELGWFAHPIFSKKGDYPESFKKRIYERSMEQGYVDSRLPEFTKSEIDQLRGSSDFFGLNHYTTFLVKDNMSDVVSYQPSFVDDEAVVGYFDPTWLKSASVWLRAVPWGFKEMLKWIRDVYDNPDVIIYENGFSDDYNATVHDKNRANYYVDYLNYLLDAIDEGCNVKGFTAWSLMDNFEWNKGYSERFGLYHVNYESKSKKRVPKLSARVYSRIAQNRALELINRV